MGVEVSENGKLSIGNQIEDQQMAINLCSDIINQYGQLIGEYSRLDDELWFSKPEQDDHDDHDDDPIARSDEGLESNFTPSLQYEYTVHQEQLSKSINNPVSAGGTTSVKEISSSLNDSSLDQSQTSSPVSVLQRKRSHPSVRKKATKRAQTESSCHSPEGLRSPGPTITPTEQSQSIHPESYTESSLLDETPEPSPTKPVRMRKVSDLLLSGGGDNQANKTSILESHLQQGFEEPGSWEEQNLNAKRTPKRKKQKTAVKKCMHCESTKTPQWREGPMGRATLCNACGVQFRKGKLFSEYRPLKSPTFDPSLHSNFDESGSWEREEDPKPKLTPERKMPKAAVKKCMHCESTETPQWREGPMGQATLCDECGVQYRKGRLFSEYRPLESPTFNPPSHSNMEESGSWEREEDPDPKPTPKRKKQKVAVKKCMHCESTKTPQWREGPMGHATLCNACGVQYRHGRLFPEYRPLKSPTFNPALHSHLPKKVQQMRMRKNAEKSAVSEDNE